MQTAVMGVVAIIFLLTVGPLCLSHCGLSAENATTLESMRKSHFARETFRWDLQSCSANCSAVYGPSVCRGMCPVASDVGDGVVFGVVFKDTLDLGDNVDGLTVGQDLDNGDDGGFDGEDGAGDGAGRSGVASGSLLEDTRTKTVGHYEDDPDAAGFGEDDAENTSTLTDNLLSGR